MVIAKELKMTHWMKVVGLVVAVPLLLPPTWVDAAEDGAKRRVDIAKEVPALSADLVQKKHDSAVDAVEQKKLAADVAYLAKDLAHHDSDSITAANGQKRKSVIEARSNGPKTALTGTKRQPVTTNIGPRKHGPVKSNNWNKPKKSNR